VRAGACDAARGERLNTRVRVRLAQCIVDAVLERRLWEEWYASFDAGDYEMCLERAEERHDALFESEEFYVPIGEPTARRARGRRHGNRPRRWRHGYRPRTCTVWVQWSGVHHR